MKNINDLLSIENTLKNMQNATTTYVDINEPVCIYRDKYKLEAYYLGNLIYMINTKPLNITIDDLIKIDKVDKVLRGDKL